MFFILIGFLFVLSFSYRQYALGGSDALLLRAAMALTLCADFFILIAEKHAVGIVFFCCVQFVYNYRYGGARRAAALGALALALTTAVLLAPQASHLAGYEKAAVVYAACLIFSVS
ncbi:MAG: hypothetical protein FWE85_05575, partial [Clostridiales bacterium]|nr:hypothetical protein [Clostridiales bacterium]